MNLQFANHISQAYSQHADKYVSVLEPTLAPMAAEMARMAGLTMSQRALDLATGTGLIARALAESPASIIGIDFSPGILTLAQNKFKGEIQLAAADAHKLPFIEGCLDLVTCGLSLSHFSDVETALSEIRRVLRPGGRLIASAWGTERKNPTRDAAVKVRRKYLPEREAAFGGTLNEDLWADVEAGCQVMELAGFVDVHATASSLSGRYKDHAAAAEAALAWPITRYQVAQLPPEDREKLRQETASAVKEVSDLRWWIEINYYFGKSG